MKLLTKVRQELYQNAKIYFICKKNLKIKKLKIKSIMKLGIIVIMQKYRGAAHSICNLKCNIPKTILVTFHNG